MAKSFISGAIEMIKEIVTSPKSSKALSVSYSTASCEFISSTEMHCPLCGMKVPARTKHACRKESR